MAKRKSGLGVSMSKLFGTDNINQNFNEEKDEKYLSKEILVDINLLQPNKNQPRKIFDEEKLKELADSIKKYGLIQPIVVKKENNLYIIVAGERRFRASKKAGLKQVPVRIVDFDKKTMQEVALIENLQRENLNVIEEAEAYQGLIDEFGYSQDEVAKKVSKSRSAVANTIRLLKLDSKILQLLKNNKITEGHARALLSIENEKDRNNIAEDIITKNLTVRDIENYSKSTKTKNVSKKEQNPSFVRTKILLKDLEEKLKNKLKTNVKIIPKNENNGKIEIDYYSKEDFDALFNILNK